MTSSRRRRHDNATADSATYIEPLANDEIGQHGYQFAREIDPDSVTIESVIATGKKNTGDGWPYSLCPGKLNARVVW